MPSPFTCARWVSSDDAAEFSKFVEANTGRLAQDAADALAILTNSAWEMKVVQDRWPKIKFHTQREHAGLILDKVANL
jgi:peptide chain release factor 3